MSWIKKFARNKIVINIFIAVVSFIIVVVLAEIFVWIFTPKGIYSCIAYDDEIGLVFSSGSKVIYNKIRYVVNTANKDGFLDISHNKSFLDSERLNVAFFGDSYVEAMQVPIEQKFFRLLPQKIANKGIEYFGFGMSGNGMLISYLTYKKQIKNYDLNIIVYVFVENDLGDNIAMIKKNELLPYAKVTDSHPGFEIDRAYRKHNSLFREILRHIYRRSLLANIIVQRIVLLRQRGIVFKLTEEEKQMATLSKNKIPEQNDLPSTWPAPIKKYVEKLSYMILKQWVKEVKDAGKEFVVFYVPRGEEILLSADKGDDTWKDWLLKSCSELNIAVIDPSEIFIRRLKEGSHMYDDHWTPEGHKAVAHITEKWLEKSIRNKK